MGPAINQRFLVTVAIVLLAGYVAVVTAPVLLSRLLFDGVLEHTEAVTHYLVAIRREQPLYVLDFTDGELRATSIIYHPLYYWYLRALPIAWMNDFSILRLVSVVPPILVAAVLIEIASFRAFQLRFVGAVWLIIVLAVFPLHVWMDLARPEALFLAGIAFVYWTFGISESWFKHICIGAGICLTFAIKQPALLLLFVPLAMTFYRRSYARSFVAGSLMSLTFFGAVYAWYGEPYLVWVFERPGGHPYSLQQSWNVFSEYAQSLLVCLLAPLILVGLKGMRSARRFEPALALFLLCIATLGIAFVPAGKLGGWIGNFVVFTWVSCIPISLITVAAMSHGRMGVQPALALAVLLALSPALLEQSEPDHLREIVPGEDDIRFRQALMRISTESRGDVWTSTWPMIDQRSGRLPRYPVQQSCTVGAHCNEFAPTLQLHEPIQRGWEAIKDREIDVVMAPDNLTIYPLDALLEEHYIKCIDLRRDFQLHHLFGQSYPPVQMWTSTRSRCESFRKMTFDAPPSDPAVKNSADQNARNNGN